MLIRTMLDGSGHRNDHVCVIHPRRPGTGAKDTAEGDGERRNISPRLAGSGQLSRSVVVP